VENHGHMVALYFMHDNLCGIHKTLRVSPAMEVGITNRVWTSGQRTAINAAASWEKVPTIWDGSLQFAISIRREEGRPKYIVLYFKVEAILLPIT
jgi:hypothetical protein